ncbi:MAG: hypothetical protein QM813_02830 [Verrucomicrobiota bacterium]
MEVWPLRRSPPLHWKINPNSGSRRNHSKDNSSPARNFYQNTRNEWVDENVQKAQNLKRQRIQFNSKEYFTFAAKERRALPWLALGQNVQFVLDETLYEIYDN